MASCCEASQEPLAKSVVEQQCEKVVGKEVTLTMTPACPSEVPKKHKGEPVKIGGHQSSVNGKAPHLSKKTFPELSDPSLSSTVALQIATHFLHHL